MGDGGSSSWSHAATLSADESKGDGRSGGADCVGKSSLIDERSDTACAKTLRRSDLVILVVAALDGVFGFVRREVDFSDVPDFVVDFTDFVAVSTAVFVA